MAKIACCHNCVYSYCDHEHARWSMSVGVLTWPACANQPDSPGRMQRVPARGICRNYRPRPATPEGEVRQIPVGEGRYAYVDAADFDRLNQWTWHFHNGYATRRDRGKTIYLHRAIMQPPPGMVVDHTNHNKLDDTRANLKVCTQQENLRNSDKRRGTASRFRGLYFCKRTSKWCPRVKFQGKYIYLGSFAEEIDAARAHDRGAVAYFGASARLNFPQEWPAERRAPVYAQAQEQRRRISARRRPAGRKDRRRTARSKPRSTGRKKAATKGAERSRTKRPAKNEERRNAAFGRNQTSQPQISQSSTDLKRRTKTSGSKA